MKGMKIVALSAIASLGLVTSTTTFAMGGGKNPQNNVEKMMKQFDTNQDGKITKEEAVAVRMAFFAKADANSDGTLSLDEFKMAEEKRQEQRFTQYFAKMDADSNGQLSLEEMLTAKKDRLAGVVDDPEKELKERFAKMDTDKSASLTAEELMEGKKKGICGGKWAEKRGNPEKHFAKMDADNNGSVSEAEFKVNIRLFNKFDGNKDGVVTKDEIVDAMQKKGKKKPAPAK